MCRALKGVTHPADGNFRLNGERYFSSRHELVDTEKTLVISEVIILIFFEFENWISLSVCSRKRANAYEVHRRTIPLRRLATENEGQHKHAQSQFSCLLRLCPFGYERCCRPSLSTAEDKGA